MTSRVLSLALLIFLTQFLQQVPAITTDAKRVAAGSTQSVSATGVPAEVNGGKLSAGEFNLLMRRLEKAWNANDAKLAADCFTENAIYSFSAESACPARSSCAV
jgi:hypothetical protein